MNYFTTMWLKFRSI